MASRATDGGGRLPILVRLKHLPGYLTDPDVSLLKKFVLVLGVVYIISPVDAIPDVIPVVGWLDDIGVMGLLVTWLLRELDRYPGARRLAE